MATATSGNMKTLIRHTSSIPLVTIALTVASAEYFSYSGAQLKANAENAVVAGFCLSSTTGEVWLWRRFSRRGGGAA